MGFLTGKTVVVTGGGRSVLDSGKAGAIGYGIVRAYAKAAKMTIDAAGVCEFRPYTVFSLTVDYSHYEKIKKELERLEKRFSRKCIQIALIGYARKGKSKFLQSVAELGDDVIPTSSSTDCTGAISIIENYDGPFQMEVEYYTLDEFLYSVSQSLTEILGSNVVVRSLDELAAYKNDVRLSLSEDNKVSTFYNDYH